MTRLIRESYIGGAAVWTAGGSANRTYDDLHPMAGGDNGHSPFPCCERCETRNVDPRLGYCRVCFEELRVHCELSSLAASGDPEGVQVYGHLKTAKYPVSEKDNRKRRARK